MASNTELKLCRIPVLLDKIYFAVIFRIVVAQMAARFDVLLEQRLLRFEVGLGVEEVATATTGLSLRTLGASALDREATLRPETALTDYLFHPLESL